MKIYTRYISQLYLQKLATTLASLIIIIWISQSLKLLDLIITKGLTVFDFLKLSTLLIPSFIFYILPFAALIALIITYSNLRNDNEIVVLQSSSLSRYYIGRPFFATCMCLCVIGLLVSNFLIPYSHNKFNELRDFFRDNYISTLIEEKIFNTDIKDVTIYIDRKLSANQFEGLFINDSRKANSETTIFAKYGELNTNTVNPTFTLLNGIRFEKEKSGNTSYIAFDSYNFSITLSSNSNSKNNISHEGLSIIALLKHEQWLYKVKGLERLMWPLNIFWIALLCYTILANQKFSRNYSFTTSAFAFLLPAAYLMLTIVSFSKAIYQPLFLLIYLSATLAIFLYSYLVLFDKKSNFALIPKFYRRTD